MILEEKYYMHYHGKQITCQKKGGYNQQKSFCPNIVFVFGNDKYRFLSSVGYYRDPFDRILFMNDKDQIL